ncbi:hypothetical protein CBL_09088 [Carabus blaptoides fortunei]
MVAVRQAIVVLDSNVNVIQIKACVGISQDKLANLVGCTVEQLILIKIPRVCPRLINTSPSRFRTILTPCSCTLPVAASDGAGTPAPGRVRNRCEHISCSRHGAVRDERLCVSGAIIPESHEPRWPAWLDCSRVQCATITSQKTVYAGYGRRWGSLEIHERNMQGILILTHRVALIKKYPMLRRSGPVVRHSAIARVPNKHNENYQAGYKNVAGTGSNEKLARHCKQSPCIF